MNEARRSDSFLRVRPMAANVDFFTAGIVRIAPFGVELVCAELAAELCVPGTRLELQFVLSGRRAEFYGVVVGAFRSEELDEQVIEVRFFSRPSAASVETEYRSSQRWVCSELHLPRAMAPSPATPNTFLSLQVRNISKDGVQLVTGIEHAYLLPEMTINLAVSLPMVGSLLIDVEIIWTNMVTDGSQELFEIGARIPHASKNSKRMLGQYLSRFSIDHVTNDLIAQDFLPSNEVFGVTFESVKTEDEYLRALAFRQKLGKEEGRSSAVPGDQDAEIVLGSSVVSDSVSISARVHYPNLQDRRKYERSVSFPVSCRSDQLIEVDDIRISDAHDSGLGMIQLLSHVLRSHTTADRQRLVVLTTYSQQVESVLLNAGFENLGTMDETTIWFGEISRSIKQEHVRMTKWLLVWKDLASEVVSSKQTKILGIDRFVIKVYLYAYPAVRTLFSKTRFARQYKKK